jgi:C_GCAxxG_C_C family probable redox protein
MDHTQRGLNYFDNGYSCSQAVLLAFADILNIDKESTLKIASGFGGGMGRTRGVCGALTGGIMALGLITTQINPDSTINQPSKEKTYQQTAALLSQFEETFGSIQCRDLIDLDLRETAGWEKTKGKIPLSSPCRQYVQYCIETVMKLTVVPI